MLPSFGRSFERCALIPVLVELNASLQAGDVFAKVFISAHTRASLSQGSAVVTPARNPTNPKQPKRLTGRSITNIAYRSQMRTRQFGLKVFFSDGW